MAALKVFSPWHRIYTSVRWMNRFVFQNSDSWVRHPMMAALGWCDGIFRISYLETKSEHSTPHSTSWNKSSHCIQRKEDFCYVCAWRVTLNHWGEVKKVLLSWEVENWKLRSIEKREPGHGWGFFGLDCRWLLPWDSSPYVALWISEKYSRTFIFSTLCAPASLLKQKPKQVA